MNESHPSLLAVPTSDLRVSEAASSGQSLKLSLIIPTYNEGQNISRIVEQLTTLLDQTIPSAYELIVVDDDSPDRTWEIAQRLGLQYPLRVMRRQSERGLSTAVIRGWQAAAAKFWARLTATFSIRPKFCFTSYRRSGAQIWRWPVGILREVIDMAVFYLLICKRRGL